MTQSSNRLIDEFARLATDAAAVAQGVRREAESAMRAQAERLMSEMNVVHRDEFDAAKDLAVRVADENERLRHELDALTSRVAALEAKLGGEAASGGPEAASGAGEAAPSGGASV